MQWHFNGGVFRPFADFGRLILGFNHATASGVPAVGQATRFESETQTSDVKQCSLGRWLCSPGRIDGNRRKRVDHSWSELRAVALVVTASVDDCVELVSLGEFSQTISCDKLVREYC